MAIASFLFARSDSGAWRVRIEDIDRPRIVPGCAEEQLRALSSYGLEPDGGVVRQSERMDLYDDAFDRLRRSGALYPCRCSRSEIAGTSSAPHGLEGPPYPGTCRDRDVDPAVARSWRFRVPADAVSFTDAIQGAQSQDVSWVVGDFVVRREKPERSYAYQLAVVVDDALQGIERVVRGTDLLESTPRQILLYRALDLEPPGFAHVPLLVAGEAGKLSKRAGAAAIASASSAVRHRIASSLLTAMGQAPDLTRAAATFSPERIPRRREIQWEGVEAATR